MRLTVRHHKVAQSHSWPLPTFFFCRLLLDSILLMRLCSFVVYLSYALDLSKAKPPLKEDMDPRLPHTVFSSVLSRHAASNELRVHHHNVRNSSTRGPFRTNIFCGPLLNTILVLSRRHLGEGGGLPTLA